MSGSTGRRWPALTEILPHRGRAVLLDRVDHHDADETVCVVEIDRAAWLRQDAGVPSWVGLEYMAQCVAAHEGCIAHGQGRTLPPGFLVRARRVRFRSPVFRPGEVLRVRAWRLRGRPALGAMAYGCEVRHAGASPATLAAEAELTVAIGDGAGPPGR